MKIFRTLSTRRLIVLIAAFAAVAAAGAAIAVASSGSGPKPDPKPLAQAIHDAVTAPAVQGISADVTFTNKLFPSGSLTGTAGSALMSGASGRLWVTSDGAGRLELQGSPVDSELVWNKGEVKLYDATSNTVYRLSLPAKQAAPADKPAGALPSVAEITTFLGNLGAHATVSAAQPRNVGGQPAYTVTLSPKHDGGLLGSAQVAWDALRGVPLDVAIYAQGSASPVLELALSNLNYGPVAASDVAISPPANSKTVDLSPPAKAGADSGAKPDKGAAVSGLAAVQAAVGFPVVAPDKLVGLPRQDVRLVGGSQAKSALVVYGQGLGGLVVLERKTDTTTPAAKGGGPLSALPTVSIAGISGHELATPLGTVLEWQRGGSTFILAGSLPPGAAETAARNLK